MAPTNQKIKGTKPTGKSGNPKFAKGKAQDVKKRKWVPEHKVFKGNVKEGQGFAFYRKEKVKHEYNRLLRKEKKKAPVSESLYKEQYPEHLKHLYMAEAEKLKSEAWTNRMNRMKSRMKGQDRETDLKPERDAIGVSGPDQIAAAAPEAGEADSFPGNSETAATPEKESFPMSNRMRKRMLKKTSSQRAKEAFEMQKEKRRKKKEEYLKNKQQREEALQRYKQKKMETFQMLNKKTKKGQPNLNLQMEYLLQKIQGPGK